MANVVIRPADRPGDLGWVVLAHGEMYSREFGWSVAFEEMVATIMGRYAAGHDTDRERAWIAEDEDPSTARLRVLLVDPKHRGLGLGAALVETCVAFARTAGFERMSLWTTGNLHSARRLYEAAGFKLTDEQPHDAFGADLVGQTWELALAN